MATTAADPLARIQAVLNQAALAVDGADGADGAVDGWLIYDFQGLNPHAARLLNLPQEAFLTRRFFVWVPRMGRPVLLHHQIEGGTWEHLSAHWHVERLAFGSHAQLDALLRQTLQHQRVALEYSPQGAVPYVSRVDAGTLERLQAAGVSQLLSSADLLQAFLRWSAEDLAAHQRSAAVLVQAKQAAFALIDQRLRAGQRIGEYEVQALIMQHIEAAGMQSGHPVNVSFGVNAADSHYEPSANSHALLSYGQCVLIDLWAQEKGRPFADMTWVGYAGTPSPDYLQAWQAVHAARQAALGLMQTRFAAQGWGQLQGWEVDRAARQAMQGCERGDLWERHFVHRTGHDLGVQLHGAGANLDDYETHDTRVLTQGLAVTIEPGTYPAALGFGIRSEIDVYLSATGPEVTTPMQQEVWLLGV